MQLSEHLASCKWLRQHTPFPIANREKAWKIVLGNDPPSGLHRKLLPLQDNAQRHNPAWNTVIMKYKNAIALNRNYRTRTIYNSKVKCHWIVWFQILSFLKSFFLAVVSNSHLLCWMRIEYFKNKWRQDAQSHPNKCYYFLWDWSSSLSMNKYWKKSRLLNSSFRWVIATKTMDTQFSLYSACQLLPKHHLPQTNEVCKFSVCVPVNFFLKIENKSQIVHENTVYVRTWYSLIFRNSKRSQNFVISSQLFWQSSPCCSKALTI